MACAVRAIMGIDLVVESPLSFFASNGGIGIYPYVISLVLINYGVSKESSLAFGWIMWTSQSLMLLIFGSLSFFILPLINKNN